MGTVKDRGEVGLGTFHHVLTTGPLTQNLKWNEGLSGSVGRAGDA